jgi:hypothetical protein
VVQFLYRSALEDIMSKNSVWALTHSESTARPTPSCPECGERVEFDGGLFHCNEDGAWDRDCLIWIDANGTLVDDPSDYSRRAAAARR